jgi:hypothetical protein
MCVCVSYEARGDPGQGGEARGERREMTEAKEERVPPSRRGYRSSNPTRMSGASKVSALVHLLTVP